MTAALALILVSMIDIPSLVSVIGALRITRWWKLPLVIFLAVIFKEILGALFNTFYEPWDNFPFTLIAQTIVAVLVFRTAQGIRKRNPDNPRRMKTQMRLYIAALIIVFGSLFAGVAYWSTQRSEGRFIKSAAVHAQTSAAKPIPVLNDKSEDGSILIFREPVEAYWNDWTAKELSTGKLYISGTGKTSKFEGIVQLNCISPIDYSWITATNGYEHKTLTEAAIKQHVPMQVISSAFDVFCPMRQEQ